MSGKTVIRIGIVFVFLVALWLGNTYADDSDVAASVAVLVMIACFLGFCITFFYRPDRSNRFGGTTKL